jgi:hypothetical protein
LLEDLLSEGQISGDAAERYMLWLEKKIVAHHDRPGSRHLLYPSDHLDIW